jgi:ChAPs (Chs5p-Arf1p-binding proteins)
MLQSGLLSGIFRASEWDVHQSVYCCYDAFSQQDIICCMSSPGGVYAYARDSAGQKCASPLCHSRLADSGPWQPPSQPASYAACASSQHLRNALGSTAHACSPVRMPCRRSVSEDIWRQVAVSAYLRYEVYDPECCASVPAAVRLRPMRIVEMEDAVLESVLWIYQNGVAQQVRLWQRTSLQSR